MCSARAESLSHLMAQYYPTRGTDPLDEAFCHYARPGMTILDAGCGSARGCPREAPCEAMFIVGADRELAVAVNPFCNVKLVADLSSRLPFADSSFDLIHCRWVLEHIADPGRMLSECARVLKPGGRVLALTPNLFHYATFVARLTPQWFHCWWRGDYEPFVTHYAANTPQALRRLCMRAGLRIERLELIEGPPLYLAFSKFAFRCGVFYEQVVNRTERLARLRQRMLLVACRDA